MQILSTIGGIAVFFIIIGIIIAVHEGGHFYFAKRAGILAREFAIGMGPILWKKKKGETLYTIRAIPLGGFCAIAGEEYEDDPFKKNPQVKLDVRDGVIHNFYLNVNDESIPYPVYDVMEYDLFDEQNTSNLYMDVIKDGNRYHFKVKEDSLIHYGQVEYQIAPYNRTLNSKSKRQRAMVMFGGPLMNFLLAILVFFLVGLIQGFSVRESSQVVIEENTAAYNAGLRTNDVITKLEAKDGKIKVEVTKWDDISKFMSEYKQTGNPSAIIVTYLRDNKTNTLEVQPTITINSLAIEAVYTQNGLKIINYIEAKDDMIDNSAISKFYSTNSNVVITKVEYEGKIVNATNLKEVYNIFELYNGKKKEKIKLYLSTASGEEFVFVKPYSQSIMKYQYKQNGIETVKVAMHVSPKTKFNFLKSLAYSVTESLNSAESVLLTLGMLIKGDISIRALSGFVGIASATVKVTKAGLVNVLYWMGLLSVNIGFLNLLPIPALDGGRLAFLAYEAITKKKPNQKVETWLITATMLLLFALMIFVTINDILRVF